ncbi:MAG: cation-translocating P-type ATPase [Nitrospirae bacterium]|nr:cation-translocating P-type ATPase [Nitrospirota bacterium]
MKPTHLELQSIQGLSEQEATRRLKEEGYNELPADRSRDLWALLLGVLKEPMFLLLLAAGTVYIVLGDLAGAFTLLVSIFGIIGITLYQEQKVERVLEALRDLSSPRALIVRDGKPVRVAGREVVRGDFLVVEEGDRVPADAVILSSKGLMVDESLLTGESVPVRKFPDEKKSVMERPGGEGSSFLYSGSLVVQGRGVAEVLATGPNSELGRIGKVLQKQSLGKTPLQQETGRLVRTVAVLGLLSCGLVVLIFGLIRGGWLEGILNGLTLAMAILPEEFPVVLTVFLALGAWRISRQRVLTRRPSAIEALGSAMVLCVDKTGTLTQNRMEVKKLFSGSAVYPVQSHDSERLPENFHSLLEFSILASEINPFDPMEKAFQELGKRYLVQTEHLHSDWTLVHEYALEPALMAMSHVWKASDGEEFVVATKGAPEAIADLCHLTETRQADLARQATAMAAEGLRVLGVAKASFQGNQWPSLQHDFNFEFVGLLGLADPLRSTVPAAIKECYSAGIRVVMMTGDYPITARAIARQAGLVPAENILTGSDLESLTETELSHGVKTTNIFARVAPEQKLRIVNAFKMNGQVVAMTGDGVNDAPALKGAHIGIAMGKRGTDVAREASSLVLLDDDFTSIVHAVRLGRRIHDNLQKAMSYLLAVHVPIAGMSLLPLIFGWPVMFMPIHIVFMEFIIDPACSIVFEAEEEEGDVMKRPPRDPDEPLFRRKTLMFLLLQGVIVLGIVLGIFGIALSYGLGERHARALAFTTLIISNLAQILTNRSLTSPLWAALKKPNSALWWIFGGTLIFLGLALYLPGLRGLFKFAPLSFLEMTLCFLLGGGSALWVEALKFLKDRARKKGS